jgi:hypothetical protein
VAFPRGSVPEVVEEGVTGRALERRSHGRGSPASVHRMRRAGAVERRSERCRKSRLASYLKSSAPRSPTSADGRSSSPPPARPSRSSSRAGTSSA